MVAPIPTPLAIYALTPDGLALARRLAAALGRESVVDIQTTAKLAQGDGGDDLRPFDSLAERMAELWESCRGHVLMGPVGVAVRCMAPLLGTGTGSKYMDPAVVAVDQAGRFAVSVLSGHVGRANLLAREAARVLGAQAVVTTGTDSAGLPAVDELARARGLRVADFGPAKEVSATLLAGESVQLHDPLDRMGLAGEPLFEVVAPEFWDDERPGVWVDEVECPEGAQATLCCRPARLFLGVGCRKGASAGEILGLVDRVLDEHGLLRADLAGLGSVQDKAEEPGLLEAARTLGLEPVFFSRDELGRVDVPSPSALVKKHMGVESICEAAAMLLANTDRVLVTKAKSAAATLAVACSRP